MNIKQTFVSVFAVLLTFGLFGTAFASSDLISQHSSEGGVYQFDFDTPKTKADEAAINYDYDPELLSKVGTETGSWEYGFDAPDIKADIAAKNHVYDMERLSDVSTEGGLWEYRFDAGSSQSANPVCSNC